MALEMNSKAVEYKDNKVIIKTMPKNGENLSVFIRPGDEVVFDINGVNSEKLEYALVGGDIVVEFPGKGALTFPSMGLMSFSSNPPQFNFGGKLFSVENLLSKIQEINELPITSVDASFKVRVSDIDEDKGLAHSKQDKTPPPQIIVVPQSQVLPDSYNKKEDFTQNQPEVKKSYESSSEVVVKNTIPSAFTKPYANSAKPNDFDAYKPKVEMIPKPDVEMIPKPDVEMIPKPDVEMIPKPEEEMIPKNDFTNNNDFTGYGNGDGNGDGDGEGAVTEAAKPVFYFKATAHQVRFSEVLNDDSTPEILGGGGSVLGYKNDSITNQFEPETLDISARTEDMVVKVENSNYFSNAPASKALVFKDLIDGQSVTVDGLTLTASGAISAADVAAGFANLTASATTGNVVVSGAWSGHLSAGWSSDAATGASSDGVTFTAAAGNSNTSAFATVSAGSTIAAPTAVTITHNQGVAVSAGVAGTTESHALTFQALAKGQSVTVDGLTLTAGGAITADAVAAGFASLTVSADGTGVTVTNGTWSGQLSTGWSSDVAAAAVVTFTSTVATTNVSDIAVTSAGSTISAPDAIDITSSDAYLSRVLRFTPQMPEGFYVDSFSISGLPSGVKILDKNGVELTGSSVTRDDMIFKDVLGEVIAYDSADFLTNFKSLEFTIKYLTSITDPFNISVTANYKLDAAYAETTDIDPEQSYTNEYTFALKDIASADDYTYKKSDFANAKDEGFILSKETNYNIIKDGSGNNVIYGGTVKDVVSDGAGDDTYYLSAGDDLLYGGSGTNYIFGDSDNGSIDAKKYVGTDTLSYEKVNSFGVSEIELLGSGADRVITSEESQKLSGAYDADTDGDADPKTGPANSLDIDMLTSYKGVYVDLDGMSVVDMNGDGAVDSDDSINAISKFANRDGRFTYDADGYAVGTSIGKTITFTSSSTNVQVEDLVISGNVAATAVVAPTALDVIKVEGDGTTTEKSDITFKDLITGQSVTIDGLKLTATGNITAAAVAAGFASLAPSAATGNVVANGTWSGALSVGWSSTAVAVATVAFTSATANTSVIDIVTASAGVTGVDGADAIEVSTKQGSSDIDTRGSEKTTLIFKDLTAGQFVSVGGLTLTANGAISASAVAAGFSELSSGATAGNTVTNGAWSGTLGAFSSSAQESGLDSIQATGYDIYQDVENITGSKYNDTIYGNAAKDNVLKGLGGSDTIDGRGGDNKLYGGDGGDTLISGTGKDYIDGEADTDTVSYVNMSEGVTVRFDRPNAEEYDYTFLNSDLATVKDKILNVENITGSGYADTIYGNSNTNFIQGGAGNDEIYAGGGYDFMDGGTGSDWITYKPSDYDHNVTKPSFMETFQGITVDLNSVDFVMVKETTTDSLIDLIKGIEKISATDGIDRIYGSNSAEEFWGWGGADRLEGRGGNDIFHGGGGDDYIRPGRGVDESHGDTGEKDYLELYDDALSGKTVQAIRLTEAGVVEHKLAGGDGSWISGYISADGVEIADGFSGIGVSNGTDDEIYGNELANVINGYAGADDIYGRGGDDTIRGGSGIDKIYGEAGNDIIYGDQDDDTIDAGDGDDTVYGYGRYTTNLSNKDTIDGGAGTNTINYSITSDAITLNMGTVNVGGYATVSFASALGTVGMYNDLIKDFKSIVGSTGADTITANDSGMTLDGWSGVDKLYGGSGDDTIIARNSANEILDGNGGIDTLKLAQNVDFRNINVTDFETIELSSYNAYFNLAQWNLNGFSKIIGGDNSRVYLYATNTTTNDAFNFNNVDFSNFSGSLYVYGYNGNDTYNFTGATLNSNTKYYMDAGGGTDTLIMDANQNINMLDNYYNTFEKFTVGASSNLNVNAYNDTGRTFSADTKDFSDVAGDVNLIGGKGNDIFQTNYEALLAGKLNIEGGIGNDIADVRSTQTNGTFLANSALSFEDSTGNTLVADMFNNIETLKLDNANTRTNDIKIDAKAMRNWFEGDTFTLDLYNNTQASKVAITNATITKNGTAPVSLLTNSDYNVAFDDNLHNFTLHVI